MSCLAGYSGRVCSREGIDDAKDCIWMCRKSGGQPCPHLVSLLLGWQTTPGEEVEGVLILQVFVIEFVDGVVPLLQGSSAAISRLIAWGLA